MSRVSGWGTSGLSCRSTILKLLFETEAEPLPGPYTDVIASMSCKSYQADEVSLSTWDLYETKADRSRCNLILFLLRIKADAKVPRSRFRNNARVEKDYQRVVIDEGFMTVVSYCDTKRLVCNIR